MKKTVYIAPQMNICLIQGQVLLNSISELSDTNVDDLGISDGTYEGEGRVKNGFNVWDNDDWSE